ncbi:MAG TPA: hypothetical protein VFI13_00870 [Gemmatimonadales bacterium]|nr:hypothetical protein [Gemmatimonadales bacterium]
MPRSLSAARVRVAADREAEWLAVAARLAGLLEARGQHLWVFRSEQDPRLWLEFSESGDRAGHRSVAERTVEELSLEARLRTLATYDPDASALWTEVPLPKER